MIRGAKVIALAMLACACSSEHDSDTKKKEPTGEVEVGPPAGFMDARGPNALTAEFKGRINPYDVVAESDDTVEAKARFTATLDDVPTELRDSPFAFSYQYPDDDTVPAELRGKKLVAFQALSVDPSSTHARYVYFNAQVAVFRNDLEAAIGSESGLVDGARASVYRIDSIYRDDKVSLVKSCLLAMRDPNQTDGTLFLDSRENQSYEDGETLTAWANIPLATDAATLSKSTTNQPHQGGFCHCSIEDKSIACADWEIEAKNDGSELSCPVPPGLLDKPADSHLTLTFKGAIGSPADEYASLAVASYNVMVAGKSTAIDYKSYAVRHPIEYGALTGEDLVTLYGIGSVEEIGTDHYRYSMTQTHVMVDALTSLKAAGAKQMSLDAEHIYSASLLDAEVNGDYGRFCPRAVLDEIGKPSAIFFCNDKNKSFEIGEPLELAANLPLTTDPARITEQFGTADCSCVKGEASVPCTSFPE